MLEFLGKTWMGFVIMIMVVVIMIMVVVIGVITHLEDQPQYKDKVVDRGVVVASGCVNGSYKGHTTYDCSTEILMENKGTVRTVLKFGTLPNDLIEKYCGKRMNMPYRCNYGRAK